jgi:hypothetical protein
LGDDRWMIRGVDPATRKVVKAAAKAEGMSVGRWVRRALTAAFDATTAGSSMADAAGERLRLLEARLDVLEKSHRTLHHRILASDYRVTPARYQDRIRTDGRIRRSRAQAKD